MRMKFSRAWLVPAAVALAGLAVAGWMAIRTPDQFVSTAVVMYQGDDPVDSLRQEVLSRSSLMRVITKENLYQDERRSEPLEDIIMGMRRKAIRVTVPYDQPSVFRVSFEYPDREKAQRVTDDLARMFIEQNLATRSGAKFVVLDSPRLASSPIAPRRSRILIMGFIGGLLLGFLLLGVRRWPMVAACGTAAAVVACAGSFLLPDRFVSTAVLLVPVDDAQKVAESITKDARGMQKMVTVRMAQLPVPHQRWHGTHQALTISYVSKSKAEAKSVTWELASRAGARVLDPPNLPETPIWPNRASITLTGLLGGVLIGITWAAVRQRRLASRAAAY